MNRNLAVNQSARLDLKTNLMFKQQLEEAAALTGVNLTAFILTAAAEKMREVKEFHSSKVLSETAWANLNEVLSTPPTVSPAMRALYEEGSLDHGRTI